MGAARAIASMAERYERPDWVRRINAMATAVGDARRMVPIDAAELLGLAQKSLAGGSAGDFGDPDWRARFERLAAALDAARMHVVGRLLTREELLRCLRTRLLLAGELERKPAI